MSEFAESQKLHFESSSSSLLGDGGRGLIGRGIPWTLQRASTTVCSWLLVKVWYEAEEPRRGASSGEWGRLGSVSEARVMVGEADESRDVLSSYSAGISSPRACRLLCNAVEIIKYPVEVHAYYIHHYKHRNPSFTINQNQKWKASKIHLPEYKSTVARPL